MGFPFPVVGDTHEPEKTKATAAEMVYIHSAKRRDPAKWDCGAFSFDRITSICVCFKR